MKKILIFSIILFLASFQAFSAGSSEGISAKDSRNKTAEIEEVPPVFQEEIEVEVENETKKEENYENFFVVSRITDENLCLEILSYKEPQNFFPEGVNFENKNQNNPLIKVESLNPTKEDYLNASLSRIRDEGGVLKIDKSSEKSRLTGNILYIFSNKETFLLVSLENSIVIEVPGQEGIISHLTSWLDDSW
ncbi:hypothetical protein K9M42_01545 [Patescibacteria group bacterium]|nr:hypothetical protein [Patescibacteria group bacterium]